MTAELTKDEFVAWRHHPVTRLVFERLQEHIKQAENMWLKCSWETGKADPILLADLRARAIVLKEIITLEHGDII
jgi:uncharacterized phage-associated protein